ncbi:MAG: mevalonate kinase [Deltaproteobacteria bacterium]|nr:mevalonate kinase [Deltaproteobacteria bacterium]
MKAADSINMYQNFPAKLMLLGEYAAIVEASSLNLPFYKYGGSLKYSSPEQKNVAETSQKVLREFYEYLLKLEKNTGEQILNLSQFHQDLDKGIFFDSSIPNGFGLGSSGALCAAIYDHYALKKRDVYFQDQSFQNDLYLKEIFQSMESFFHQKSSGIDPLVCFFKKPILVKAMSEIESIDVKLTSKIVIYLVDSEISRHTSSYVKFFLEKYKNKSFRKEFESQYVKNNEICVSSLIHQHPVEFWESLKEISRYQNHYMQMMIPSKFKSIWEEGLESNLFFFKLCGAGGGGYLLAFSLDPVETEQKFAEYGFDYHRLEASMFECAAE